MLQVQIRIRGHIDRDWSDSLASLDITHSPDGVSVLAGSVRDQAALYGLLSQLSNLGLGLVSFSCEDMTKQRPPQSRGERTGPGRTEQENRTDGGKKHETAVDESQNMALTSRELSSDNNQTTNERGNK